MHTVTLFRHLRDAHGDVSFRQPGKARHHRQSGGGYTEKRHEDRILPAVVHIRQIVEGKTVTHSADDGAKIKGPGLRDQNRIAEAQSPVKLRLVPGFV